MDSNLSLNDPKKFLNGIDYLKQAIDLSAKNSEDYDSTQLNKSKLKFIQSNLI